MVRIKKILIWVLLLLVILSSVNAIPKKEIYKGISLKFYGNIDKGLCYENLERIPSKYLRGVTYINFMKRNSWKSSAFYFWYNQGIIFHDSCEVFENLIHELTHHKQKKEGDPIFEAYNHSGNFDKYYEEIEEEVKTLDLLNNLLWGNFTWSNISFITPIGSPYLAEGM